MAVTSHLFPTFVALTRHIYGPGEISFDGVNVPDYPHIMSGRMEWDRGECAYQLVRLDLQRKADGIPITGASLRTIQVAQLVALLGRGELEKYAMVCGRQWRWSVVKEQVAQAVAAGRPKPTPETLELVAIVYEFAQILGEKPVKMLQELFGLAPSTANHWVRLARERGHLDA